LFLKFVERSIEQGKNTMNYVEKHTTHHDKLTGEVTHNSTTVSYENKIPSEPAYIKLYTDDLGNLFGLSLTASNVLLCLASMADYAGEIIVTKGVKTRIANRIGAKITKTGKPSLSGVSNALTDMIKAGIISRVGDVGSGIYMLNPNLFARGKWKDIYEKRKDFKITITYSDKGKNGKREIVTEQLGGDVVQLFPEPETAQCG
jgi:hypothetical protein